MSLYSLDLLKFQEADFQLSEWERRREFSLLHRDAQKSLRINTHHNMGLLGRGGAPKEANIENQ